jgi:hypothetical protein
MSTHGLRRLSVERLEQRRCLAASVGWDGPGAGSSDLLYTIGTVPDDLDREQVESTIEAALDVWSDVADVNFRPTTERGQADAIDFKFKSLDGPGGTLARAYFPDDLNRNPIAGDVEFDIGDPWEVGNELGSAAYDLMLVAVHEIGHALGLSHSHSEAAVMHHAVSSHSQFTGLSQDDIDLMLQLYAPAPALPSATPPVQTPEPHIQEGPSLDPSNNLGLSPSPPPETTPQESSRPGETGSSEGDSSEQPHRPTNPPAPETSPWDMLRHRLRVMRTALLRLSFSAFASDVDSLFSEPDWDFG